METGDRVKVLTQLISARTALKTDKPRLALTRLREAIKLIDPDGEIERQLRQRDE